jgi:hypothetical protein
VKAAEEGRPQPAATSRPTTRRSILLYIRAQA